MASLNRLILPGIYTFISVLFFFSGGVYADNGQNETGRCSNITQEPTNCTDQRVFTTNTVVKVYLNYDSFETLEFDEDFPSFTQENMEHAIRIAIDNWMQVTHMRLRVRYEGTTDDTEADDRQIIIRADTKAASGSGTVADATMGNLANRSRIRIYRTDSTDNDHPWSVFPDGSADNEALITTLVHEMGHSWGLAHNFNADAGSGDIDGLTTLMGWRTTYRRFGPFRDDIEDVIDMYGYRNDLDVHVRRSTNQGASWSDISSNIDSINIQTALPLSVSRDDDRMIMFHTTRDKKPSWLIGHRNATDWDADSYTVFGGERSLYGTSGHGWDDEYMMTWVDRRDENRVRVVRSRDGGESWTWKNPSFSSFGSRAGGTPAVQKLEDDKWMLTYTKLENDLSAQHGRVVSRISTDDGNSWGPETELLFVPGFTLPAVGGVSVSSRGEDDIRIMFTAIDNDSQSGSISTNKVELNSSDNLVWRSTRLETNTSSILQPSVASTFQNYYIGFRGLDRQIISDTSLTGTIFDGEVTVDSSRHLAAPAMAARRNAAWVYMFTLE